MQTIMNSTIAKLLDQSRIPAVIINNETDAMWYNGAYINALKEFPNLIDALQVLFSINKDEVLDFIKNTNSEKLEAKHENTKYYILKEYNKACNFTIISIIPEDKCEYSPNSRSTAEKYFFMNVSYPCVIFDFYTRKVETVNNAFVEICGISVEHIRNMYMESLFYESTNLISNYLNAITPYAKNFLISKYNADINKVIVYEINPIIKEEVSCNEKTYKVIFMLRDIFEEIETIRENICEDFLRYQFLTHTTSDCMLVVNNGIITDVNHAACLLWGYDREELLNQPLSLVITDISYQNIGASSAQKNNSAKFIGIKKDKTQFNGTLKVQAFHNINKHSMIYIVRDLANCAAVTSIVENKDDFTSKLFDTQPNMIAIYDENHVLTRCNRLFLEFFGCTTIEEVITNIGDISDKFTDSDDNTFITKADKDNWFKLPLENKHTEYMVGMNDTTGKYNLFHLKTTLMKHDSKTYYVVSFTDITDTLERKIILKEANNLISSHSDDLRSIIESNITTLSQYQKLATIGTMIGFITHQWKQPLNAIGLIAQNIEDIIEEDEEFDKEDLLDMMHSIMNHVMFMSETMENFKNFFKPNDSSIPFKLVQTVKSIIVLITPVLKKNNVDIVYDIPAPLEAVKVFGFPNDLKQVIMNIAVNGKDSIITRKESEPDLKGRLLISMRDIDNERVVITITDNGTGLSEEALKKMCEMHYTTKGSKGTGIGMYMAQIIIEKMNGLLKIQNREDGEKGAQLIIDMPIYHGQQ